jgi:TP901 family phage tail tape measure protein
MAGGRELAAVFKAKDEMSAEMDRIKGNLGDMEHKFAGVSSGAVAAGAAMAVAVTAVIALGAAAVKLGQEFDEAFDSILIKSGATGDNLAQLSEDFKAVVANVPTDFKAAADAIGGLHARTGQTGEGLQALAEQMLNLSRLTGSDVNENVRATTRAFGDWSISTEEQSLALDKLFRGAQMSGSSVAELSQRIVQFGAPLRALGVSFEESVAMMAKWEKEGVNVETVAGTMRLALAKFAEAGLDPADTFNRLINTIESMEDPIEATQLAMEVFGKRGGADMAAAIREGRFAIAEYVEELENAGGIIKDTASKTDDAQQEMEKAWNELKVAAEPVVTVVFEAMQAILTASVPLMKDFARELSNVAAGFKALKDGKITWSQVAAAAIFGDTGMTDPDQIRVDAAQAARLAQQRRDAGIETEEEAGPREAAAAKAAAEAQRAAQAEKAKLNAEEIARLKKDKEAERAQAAADRETQRQQAAADREIAQAAAAAERKRQQEAAQAVREAERILEQQRREAERAAEIEAQRINTIRDLGARRAQAIEEAGAAAEEAYRKANTKAFDQIAETKAQIAKEKSLGDERKRLQDEITKGTEAIRDRQAGSRLGTSDTRADDDLVLRRSREDADIAERRARAAQTNAEAERKSQDAINAARFGGDSRQVLAAMLAAQESKKQRKDQFAEEERQLALRRQREDEDIARSRQRRAEDIAQQKADAQELTDELKRLNEPLERFNQKILEDNLAEKIKGYVQARDEALRSATENQGRRTAQAEEQFRTGVERANNIGVPQTVILNNYNYGVQGPDAIHEMIAEDLAEAADALRVE